MEKLIKNQSKTSKI